MWAFSRFVRYFDEAARRGSMRRAGEALHISSSSVDRQVLRIEEELGAPLFERLPQGLRLTAAGELVLHAVRRWRDEMQALESSIEDLKGLRRGKVSLAVVEGAASEFVAGAVTDFHALHPGVTYDVLVYGAHRVTEAVLAGEVDVGLTINPRLAPGLEVVAQRTFRIGAVVPVAHALAQRGQVRLSDCIPYRVVVAEQSLDLRAVVDRIMARSSARPDVVASSNSIMLMKELVLRGMGVGLLTEMDAHKEITAGQLRYLPLGERGIPPSKLSLCIAAGRSLALPASTLLAGLRHRLGQL